MVRHQMAVLSGKSVGNVLKSLLAKHGITLEDCTFDAACDRIFEDSRNINATIKGAITEVKNPISGHIVADKIGQITYNEFAKGNDCVIETRK